MENSHSPDKTWMTACWVEVCSVNSWPSAKPKSTVREWAVRSRVRLTMPLAAYLVSSASDRIFVELQKQRGFSVMMNLYSPHRQSALTQVKFSRIDLIAEETERPGL